MRYILYLLFLIIISCTDKLPFGLKIIKYKTYCSINDKNGYPVLSEGFFIGGQKEYPKIKKLLTYSVVNDGLLIKILSNDNQIKYVKMIPKKEQDYVELELNYYVISEKELKNIDLDWTNIQ